MGNVFRRRNKRCKALAFGNLRNCDINMRIKDGGVEECTGRGCGGDGCRCEGRFRFGGGGNEEK